jgi:uncharacterized Tic20 family protein
MSDQMAPQPMPTYPALTPVSPADERTWGMLAHLSVLLNLFTGFLGPVAALIIYLVYKDKSRFIAYHALQSLVFQLIAWVGGSFLTGAAWLLSGILSTVFIGILCVPFACLFGLLPIAAIVYSIIGAVLTSQGQDFRYWLVGDLVRGTLAG